MIQRLAACATNNISGLGGGSHEVHGMFTQHKKLLSRRMIGFMVISSKCDMRFRVFFSIFSFISVGFSVSVFFFFFIELYAAEVFKGSVQFF
jgi:hypothetical protein